MKIINQSQNQFSARNKKLRLRKMTYQDFLKSDKWLKVRKYLYQFKEYRKCYFCNATQNLNYHHHTYRNLFKMVSRLKLAKIDVVCLCNRCHERLHILARENNWGLRQTFRRIKKNPSLLTNCE